MAKAKSSFVASSQRKKSNRGPSPNTSTLLMLCARSAGRCEFEGCNRVLFRDEITLNEFNDTNVAHIVASSPDGPRGDPVRSHQLSDKIENLMLVCLEHHKMIVDKKLVDLYPEERLLQMKHRHESAMALVGEALTLEPSHILFFTSRIKGAQDVTISKNLAVSAMLSSNRPVKAEPDTIRIECDLGYDDADYWKAVDASLKRKYLDRVENITQQDPRAHFSVFPLAPIPMIMKLGYLMGDKVRAEVYQKRCHSDTWNWQNVSSGTVFSFVKETCETNSETIALVVSLSARKSSDEKRFFAKSVDAAAVYEIAASKPSVDCIVSKEDLSNFWHAYQSTVNEIMTDFPKCKEICILPAVPVSAAFVMGSKFMRGVYPMMRIFDCNNGFTETLTTGE